ncbi:MAG: hypothetical protein IKJ48_07915 [Alistipes sp.]|nr:hypothetical protein [Alistipes sp.]
MAISRTVSQKAGALHISSLSDYDAIVPLCRGEESNLANVPGIPQNLI